MVLNIILVVICMCLIAFVVNAYEKKIKKNNRKISFRESIDLADLPIITLHQGNKKFNFLLDTGSNYSHISKEAVKHIKGEIANSELEVTGIGKSKTSGVCNTSLSYKDMDYNISLHISPSLTKAFSAVKSETGIQVHGIIGNLFFQEHKYVLDFKDLIAYSKK